AWTGVAGVKAVLVQLWAVRVREGLPAGDAHLKVGSRSVSVRLWIGGLYRLRSRELSISGPSGSIAATRAPGPHQATVTPTTVVSARQASGRAGRLPSRWAGRGRVGC